MLARILTILAEFLVPTMPVPPLSDQTPSVPDSDGDDRLPYEMRPGLGVGPSAIGRYVAMIPPRWGGRSQWGC